MLGNGGDVPPGEEEEEEGEELFGENFEAYVGHSLVPSLGI